MALLRTDRAEEPWVSFVSAEGGDAMSAHFKPKMNQL